MDLSKEKMFIEFHSKIHFKDIYEYALSKVVKPTSIDMIRGIIGGPNTIYKCIQVAKISFLMLLRIQNGQFCSWRIGVQMKWMV